MLAALRENWKYKLLALVCAVSLHGYVVAQNTGGQARTLIVPLSVHGAPAGLLLDEKSLPPISVTLEGPADDLAHISDPAVTASVDLSHARAGQNGPIPVHVSLPPGVESLVTADPQPSAVPLTLQAKSRRRLHVSVTEPGTPPAGYAFRAPQVTPGRAVVEGSRDAVGAVQQLIVKMDEDTIGTIDQELPIVALDSDGSPVAGVSVTPATVHVRVEMVRIPLSRSLLVSPSISGAPAFPARVTDIQVSPPTLTVTGRTDRLAQIGTISTTAIDVGGATGDIVRQVTCTPPPGVSLVGSGVVTVTIRIAGVAPGTAPAVPSLPTPQTSALPPH